MPVPQVPQVPTPASYLNAALQALRKLQNPPAGFTPITVGEGLPDYLLVGWDQALEGLWPREEPRYDEGVKLHPLLLAAFPERFSSAAPLLTKRLLSFSSLLTLLPVGLTHDGLLSSMQESGVLAGYYAYRQQLFRLLTASLTLRRLFRTVFEDNFKECLTRSPPVQVRYRMSDNETCLSFAPLSKRPSATNRETSPCQFPGVFTTQSNEEFAACLNGERYGILRTGRYLVVRLPGYVEHILTLGERVPSLPPSAYEIDLLPPTLEEDPALRRDALLLGSVPFVRAWFQARGKRVSDKAVRFLFATEESLARQTYDPYGWLVMKPLVVPASVALSRQKRTFGKRLRGIHPVMLDVPSDVPSRGRTTEVLFLRNRLYVDVGDLSLSTRVEDYDVKDVVTVVGGVRVSPFFHDAFVEPERLFVTPLCVVHHGKNLSPSLVAWLRHGLPMTKEDLVVAARLTKNRIRAKEKKPIYSPSSFSEEEDAYLLRTWKVKLRGTAWIEIKAALPTHSLRQIRLRARMLNQLVKHRECTLEEARDVETAKSRLGPELAHFYKDVLR